MGISRISKINSVGVQIHQKPYTSLYNAKKQPYRANEQMMVDKFKVDIYNETIDEVLKHIPYNEQYLFLKDVFKELGLRED